MTSDQDKTLTITARPGLEDKVLDLQRYLRMARLQTKISGCFRTKHGARSFATVRSYVETGRKHGANPFDILLQLFKKDPWKIPTAIPSR